jgi:glyoxylase-like metal-dependent hydrolase (beta-lactamase superfamily II)
MLQIGDIRIHLVSDATIMVDGGGPYGLIPRSMWSKVMPPDADNLVPQTLTCLLVQTADRTIVVDSGVGSKVDDRWQAIWRLQRPHGSLLDGLARCSVQPEDVDTLILTHLHADHSGGATRIVDGQTVPTFPNATVITQRREYEDAMRPNERTRATYLSENFEPMREAGKLRLLDGDTDIAPGVRGVVTPGHTPGHMSVLFESEDEKALFLCDLAAYAVNFERLAWIPSYDVEPLISLETKRQWQQWAIETGATLIFPHDPVVHCGIMRLGADGKPKVERLDEGYV